MVKVYAPQNDYLLSEDILHLINLDRSGQPLVPRLQLLNWTTARAFLPWLHLLLSPSLSEIHIDLNGGRTPPVNVAVIRAIPTTHLKYIAFSTLHSNTEVDAALLDLFHRSKRLESFYMQQESGSEEASPPNDEVGGAQEPIELEDLTSITIGFKSESTFLSSLFKRTTLPNIQKIHFMHLGRTEWLGGDRLFDSVLRSASPRALHALRYTSHYYGMDITSARIQQLRSFVALKTVRVTSSCSTGHCKFLLSDDDISTIASAMPNLGELYLGGTPCASTPVNVSMNGLATIAANCTKLTDLQIHFDAARFITRALDVPSEQIAPLRSTQNSCRLTQLNVGRIPLGRGVDGYWVVGMALLQIFPNLKNIKHHQQQHQLFGMNDWGEVMRIIGVQRNVTNLTTGTSGEFTAVRVSNTQPV